MRYLTKMERSCWRGKQRVKGAKLSLWRFLGQEQRWLLRKRRPFLIPWTANVYVRYAGFAWFSSVPDPNDWTGPTPLQAIWAIDSAMCSMLRKRKGPP